VKCKIKIKTKIMTYLLLIGPWQIILILVAVFIGIIPTIIALIDILRSEFTRNNKMVWLIVVLFTNLFGTILYFLIGREQKIKITK
jgi:hypothetical protein